MWWRQENKNGTSCNIFNLKKLNETTTWVTMRDSDSVDSMEGALCCLIKKIIQSVWGQSQQIQC